MMFTISLNFLRVRNATLTHAYNGKNLQQQTSNYQNNHYCMGFVSIE